MIARPFVESLGLHLVLLGLLLLSLPQTRQVAVPANRAPLQAVAVDAAQVEQELQRLQAVENEAARERAAAQQALERQQAQITRERERLAQLEQQRKAEQAALERTRQKQREEARRQEEQAKAAEQARVAREKAQRDQQEAEAARRQAEQQRREAEAARQKAEAERKAAEAAARKAEQERQARQQAEAEAKRRQEELRVALEAEQRELEASEVARYQELIRQQVSGTWLKPPDWPAGRACEVRVRLVPGGEVVAANVVGSCGSSVLDRSVEAAVAKASPLPVPPDPALFDREFRNFTFVFRDES